ncbi:hypothetical protein [Streptomyces buecherae]|uniref:hypothetical protein n=1 Tax=Streptomyces buecherae TaxID=2763006 RepID=UPI003799B0AE
MTWFSKLLRAVMRQWPNPEHRQVALQLVGVILTALGLLSALAIGWANVMSS